MKRHKGWLDAQLQPVPFKNIGTKGCQKDRFWTSSNPAFGCAGVWVFQIHKYVTGIWTQGQRSGPYGGKVNLLSSCNEHSLLLFITISVRSTYYHHVMSTIYYHYIRWHGYN